MSKTEALKRARAQVGPLVRDGLSGWRYSVYDARVDIWREQRAGRGYFSAHAARGEAIRQIAADLQREAGAAR